MARLNDTQRTALGNWWTLAQAASSGGYTTTDVMTAASDLAAQAGIKLTFAESSAIATLYGYARRMDNAAGVFQAADFSSPVTPDMIGVPPWARDEQIMNTAPIWHATFKFTYIDAEGMLRTDYKTSIFEMTLPSTVGELNDAILEDGMALAGKYNVTFVSADPHSLLAV